MTNIIISAFIKLHSLIALYFLVLYIDIYKAKQYKQLCMKYLLQAQHKVTILEQTPQYKAKA